MQVINTTTYKAKKEHICNYCGLKITIGEIYENQTNVGNGELYHWKSHLSCIELTKKLDMFEGDWGEGLTADDFREYVWQYSSDNGLDKDDLNWTDTITKVKEVLLDKENNEKVL